MRYSCAWRVLAMLTLIVVAALVAHPAQAQNATPGQRVVAGCVGYSTGLADDLSGAGRNTPAWDNVFRPAREECLRRNGPENMPNGSMFAPFYNSNGNGNDTPHGGYRLTLTEFNQGRVVLGACRAYSFRQADPIGARASTAWFNAFGAALRNCLNNVGARPDGSALLSPPLPRRNGGLALAVAYGLGDENQSYCPTDECITVGGTAIPLDLLRWIANTPLPGGTGTAGNGSGGNDGGDSSGSNSQSPFPTVVEVWKKICTTKPGQLPSTIKICLLEVCYASGYIAAQCDEMAQRVVDSIFGAMLAGLSANAAKLWNSANDLLGKLGNALGDLKDAAAEHPVAATLGIVAIAGVV
jgi:hypothetical protein